MIWGIGGLTIERSATYIRHTLKVFNLSCIDRVLSNLIDDSNVPLHSSFLGLRYFEDFI